MKRPLIKLLLLSSIMLAITTNVIAANSYLFTRFDNKASTTLLNEFKDYRIGAHLETDLSTKITLFTELGIINERGLFADSMPFQNQTSHDIVLGCVFVPADRVTVIMGYNINAVTTLGNSVTILLQYSLNK